MKNNPVFTPWWFEKNAPSTTHMYHWDSLNSTHALAQKWIDRATEQSGSTEPDASFPAHILSRDIWFFLKSDRQLLGQGQAEKSFFSPLGGLYTTLICQWPILPTTPALAILTALAVATALPVPCTLKWFNDLYLGPNKLGGILIHRYWQEHAHTCIISIGLNINTTVFETPDGCPISSLCQHTGVAWDIGKIYKKIQKTLWIYYQEIIAQGGLIANHALAEIHSRLREYGKTVRCMTTSGPVTGVCTGISPSGAMILDGAKEYVVLSLCILE